LELWCHALVRDDLLSGNPLLKVLEHYCGVNWHDVPLGGVGFSMADVPGLRFEALPLISNAPPYSPHRDRPQPGDNVGVDLNTIPAAAIERVEVLLDGASAVYGSDAIGGLYCSKVLLIAGSSHIGDN
jgi:hypothetical protein